MNDPATVPLVPHDILQILWIGIFAFASVIGLLASTICTLAWWVSSRITRSEDRCREENARERSERMRDSEKHHEATMAFAHATAEVAEALKGLKYAVRDAADLDIHTPAPHPVVTQEQAELHQLASRHQPLRLS